MNERNGEKVALFITNDRSLYDFEAQVTEVKESGSAETKYRFTVGRLTSSNAIPMTPFMEACTWRLDRLLLEPTPVSLA